MTSKCRRAIITYWMLKRFADFKPMALRRFYMRSRSVAIVLMLGCLVAPSASAAERTAADVAADLKKLISVEKKPAAAEPVAAPIVKEKAPMPVASKKPAASPFSLLSEPKKETAIILPEAAEADDKVPGVVKYFKGVVAAKNNYGMAVTYETDKVTGVENEIWAEFKKSTLLKGYKRYTDILEGDRVQLTVKQVKTKEGIEKRILKQVDFIQHAPKEAEVGSSGMVKI